MVPESFGGPPVVEKKPEVAAAAETPSVPAAPSISEPIGGLELAEVKQEPS